MITRFEPRNCRACQQGAALAVTLVIVSTTMLFAAASLRDATIATQVTHRIAAQAGARLAAVSALESIVTEIESIAADGSQLSMTLGPDSEYHVTVISKQLDGLNANAQKTYYEVIAEALGPANIRHRRRMHIGVSIASDTEIE